MQANVNSLSAGSDESIFGRRRRVGGRTRRQYNQSAREGIKRPSPPRAEAAAAAASHLYLS